MAVSLSAYSIIIIHLKYPAYCIFATFFQSILR